MSFANGLPTGQDVVLYLDSDRNEASGAPSQLGADYALRFTVRSVTTDRLSYEYSLSRWDGAGFARVSTGNGSGPPPEPPNTLALTLDSEDLGGTSGFNFTVTTENQAALARLDRAPDQAAWAFDLMRPTRSAVDRAICHQAEDPEGRANLRRDDDD